MEYTDAELVAITDRAQLRTLTPVERHRRYNAKQRFEFMKPEAVARFNERQRKAYMLKHMPHSYAAAVASTRMSDIRRKFQEARVPRDYSKQAMTDLYLQSALKTMRTGIPHAVHHVIPLQGLEAEYVETVQRRGKPQSTLKRTRYHGEHSHLNCVVITVKENAERLHYFNRHEVLERFGAPGARIIKTEWGYRLSALKSRAELERLSDAWFAARTIKIGNLLPELLQGVNPEASKDARTVGLSPCPSVPNRLRSAALQPRSHPKGTDMNAIQQLSATLAQTFTPEPADSGTVVKLTREQVRAQRYPSQTKHEARRTAAIKDTEGGKVVEAVKQASKRKPAAKVDPDAPVADAYLGRAPVQNGVKAPRSAGAIASAWDLFDQFPETTQGNLLDYHEATGLNLGNMKTELGRWRRYMGLSRAAAAK